MVLAAVLYILISGLTKGPGTTPLGTAFAWGPANNITGTAATGCAATTHDCYSLEVGSASSGLQTGGMSFTLRGTSGATLPFKVGATVTLVSAQGNSLAIWTVGATSSSWSTTNVALSGGQTLVIDNGLISAGGGLNGATVVAVGQGGFQGEVTSQALN